MDRVDGDEQVSASKYSRSIRRDGGDLSWDSDVAPAVAEVAVSIAPGVVVVVDAADTSTVLRWHVAEGGGIRALAAACVEPGLGGILERAASGIESECDAVHLDARWTRLGLTAACGRWSMVRMNESVLVLDGAAARHRIGDTAAAARLFAVASATLEGLGVDCLNGEMSSSAAKEMAIVTLEAAEAVSETTWGYVLMDLAARVQAATAFDDDTLRQWIEDLVETQSLSLVDTDMAGDGTRSRASVFSGYIDPHVVPPRILAWRGASTPDIEATYRAEGETGRVILSAQLAQGIDAHSREAGEMLAYAANRRSGQLLVSVPMVADGTSLIGMMEIDEDSLSDICFGIFCASSDPRDLRAGDSAGVLVDVDRLMLEAWGLQRAKLTALYVANSTSESEARRAVTSAARGFTREALDAAESAVEKLTWLNDEFGRDSQSWGALLESRIEAIERFMAAVEDDRAEPPGTQPLLAELLITPSDDNDRSDGRS
jgi:hypothetical protein